MTAISRRSFLGTVLVAASAPALIFGQRRAPKFPIAFSTLGCPKWPWKTVLDQAYRLGYPAIELRGIEGEMDLTKRPEFAPGRLGQSIKDLEALDLHIS